MEPERRWRVTLSCRDDAPFSLRDDPGHFSEVDRALASVARGQQDAGRLFLSYEQHGPDASISVNVTAATAESAEEMGRTLFVNNLPAWITVLSVEARPLKAEPDFT